MDVVKIGIVTGASIAMASGFVAVGFTLAVGPIIAVVFVGVFGSMVLAAIDDRYHITESVITGLDEMGDDINAYYKQTKQAIKKEADNVIVGVIDYAIESAQKMFIHILNHQLDKFLSRQLKVF